VFNAQAQSGAFYAHDLLRAGVRKFRIELVDEQGSVVGPLLQGYRWVGGAARRVCEWVRPWRVVMACGGRPCKPSFQPLQGRAGGAGTLGNWATALVHVALVVHASGGAAILVRSPGQVPPGSLHTCLALSWAAARLPSQPVPFIP